MAKASKKKIVELLVTLEISEFDNHRDIQAAIRSFKEDVLVFGTICMGTHNYSWKVKNVKTAAKK